MITLRNASFICLYVVIGVLVITTLLDPLTGSASTASAVYSSLPFTLLWAVFALLSLAYIIRCKLWRMPATFLLHMAFLVILCGALTTYIWGEQGTLILTKGAPSNRFVLTDGTVSDLPFHIQLQDFQISFYEGTHSPQDYISTVQVTDKGENLTGTVSMNKIFSYKGYRFYQAGYEADLQSSRFQLAHDPYGISITYTGYALLLLGMLLFFFQPQSRFRRLLREKAVLILLLLGFTLPTQAATQPKVAPREVAEALGNLHILHNGRVAPLQTFARDFTTKLYGKPTYRQRESVEILAGWVFFPDTWKPEPMIKLKGSEVKHLLGTDQTYVALTAFADYSGKYKLEETLTALNRGQDIEGKANILAANEKINIINSVFTGAALKIFPIKDREGHINWYSSVDDLPQELDIQQWTFIRKSLDLVAEKITTRQYTEAIALIQKIRDYQVKECAGALPTEQEFQSELLYNRISATNVWAMACVTLGLLLFFYYVYCTARQKKPSRTLNGMMILGMLVVMGYLLFCLYLRTVISHHLPLANGYETMQALAASCFLLTLCIHRKYSMALPFGYLVGGLALLVAMMGQSNPAVTNLMPVLQSPLLSLHVMVIMVAYALLAFIALNGLTALYFLYRREPLIQEVKRLRRMSLLLLYPAVFLLTAGIFIGAIWANVSWGRYWGWDPKEVWALITLLVYAVPLHGTSIQFLKTDRSFHAYMALAFLSVLFTYFGVNFLLGGMHSYAG